MPYGIIFDMDGVLVDSAPYHYQSYLQFAEEVGIQGINPTWFKKVFGRTAKDILPGLFERELTPEEVKRYDNRKEVLYRAAIQGHVAPLPGLISLIEGLRDLGWKMGIGSSGPRENVELVIDELGLRPFVTAAVSAADVIRGKPDPEVFLKTAEKMGIPPSCCVVVEDATVGVRAARAAGMRCIAITTTHEAGKLQEADRIVDSFEELTPDRVLSLVVPEGPAS